MRCKHFVADKVQTNALWSNPVKEVDFNGLAHIAPKLIPRAGLGKNIKSKALGAVAPVRLLRDFKNQFDHSFIFALACGRRHLAVWSAARKLIPLRRMQRPANRKQGRRERRRHPDQFQVFHEDPGEVAK
jgi:hypothetical protein